MTKWGPYDCEDECKEDEEGKQDLVPLIPNGIHWYEGDTLAQDHYPIVVTGSRVYVDFGKMESYYIGAESVPDGDIDSTNDTAISILAESTSPKPSAGNELQTVAKTSQAGEQK